MMLLRVRAGSLGGGGGSIYSGLSTCPWKPSGYPKKVPVSKIDPYGGFRSLGKVDTD